MTEENEKISKRGRKEDEAHLRAGITCPNARKDLIPPVKPADSELKACRRRLKVKVFSLPKDTSLIKEGAYLDSINCPSTKCSSSLFSSVMQLLINEAFLTLWHESPL